MEFVRNNELFFLIIFIIAIVQSWVLFFIAWSEIKRDNTKTIPFGAKVADKLGFKYKVYVPSKDEKKLLDKGEEFNFQV